MLVLLQTAFNVLIFLEECPTSCVQNTPQEATGWNAATLSSLTEQREWTMTYILLFFDVSFAFITFTAEHVNVLSVSDCVLSALLAQIHSK